MSTLISELKLPGALKELTGKQLEQVAADVREKIIEVTARTGGHVASSLGAVDLAVAIHATFNSPRDKIVWDVGHQAYAHKILTGRLEDFGTLRQSGGISGFPKISESEHDAFGTGHASTSISAALGIAKARDLRNEKYSVVAVIGDGSMSGGLAYEGVNNAAHLKTNIIVILNDNEMSISKNVGAMANYLTQLATSDVYNDLRDRVEKLVTRIPKVGIPLFQAAKKLKDRTKHIVMSFKVDVIFEEWGFKYFGPIDGHNIPLIMSTLHHAREIEGPVLIHVHTKKGKGYPPAEKDPTCFHGIGAFDLKTGQKLNGSDADSYTAIFGRMMTELAKNDRRLVGITAAMIDGTGLEEFADKFPDRFFDVGIAEEHAVEFAAGLAVAGMRPVAAIYSTFLQRAYDQIIQDVCLQNLPVTFCLDRAGVVGEDGPTHHGLFDLAYLRLIPNLIVMAPKDGGELEQMLKTAVHHDGPAALRYPRGKAAALNGNEAVPIVVGKGELLFQPKVSGAKAKVAILAIGSMVGPALAAAKLLAKEVIAPAVVNARFLKPLDSELILKTAAHADLIVTIEEGVLAGGFGSAVVELLEEKKITKPVIRLGFPDIFIEQGPRAVLLEKYGLSADGIAEKIKEAINEK